MCQLNIRNLIENTDSMKNFALKTEKKNNINVIMKYDLIKLRIQQNMMSQETLEHS